MNLCYNTKYRLSIITHFYKRCNSLDKELQKYYEERFSMMSSQGWKDLVEDTQNLFDSYNQVGAVTTSDQLFYRKGQLDILNWILTLKEVSAKSYEELNEKNI